MEGLVKEAPPPPGAADPWFIRCRVSEDGVVIIALSRLLLEKIGAAAGWGLWRRGAVAA